MSEQRELILKLKSVAKDRGLTIKDIMELTQFSKSTISRVFQEGSENESFRPDTLKVIEKSIMDDNAIQIERIKAIEKRHEKEVTELKLEIQELNARLSQNEKEVLSMMGQMNRIIDDLNTQISFKSKQIDIKDKRMDQKDARYDRLFDEFVKLTEQMFNKCENCHMKK